MKKVLNISATLEGRKKVEGAFLVVVATCPKQGEMIGNRFKLIRRLKFGTDASYQSVGQMQALVLMFSVFQDIIDFFGIAEFDDVECNISVKQPAVENWLLPAGDLVEKGRVWSGDAPTKWALSVKYCVSRIMFIHNQFKNIGGSIKFMCEKSFDSAKSLGADEFKTEKKVNELKFESTLFGVVVKNKKYGVDGVFDKCVNVTDVDSTLYDKSMLAYENMKKMNKHKYNEKKKEETRGKSKLKLIEGGL